MKGTIKKIANGDLPTGPDKYYGGDGLPDWMQFSITVGTVSYTHLTLPTNREV